MGFTSKHLGEKGDRDFGKEISSNLIYNNNNNDDNGNNNDHNYYMRRVMAVYCPHTRQVEMLFISRLRKSESEWGQYVSRAATSTAIIIHLQVGFMIQGESSTLSCIDRLMAKVVAASKCGESADNFYLDSYRMATRGIMHHLDTRIWKMSKASILRLQRISSNLQTCIAAEKAKKEDIVSQIKMILLASHHVKILDEKDPIKYGHLAVETLEKHGEDILDLERQEMDIVMEIENLHRQNDNIIDVLKRQLQIQCFKHNNNNRRRRRKKPLNFGEKKEKFCGVL
jgi:hypothetical protein